ncbi:major facilitator superfamily domain-containing protein [Dendryphion nanum]|uniref:Major facilitator superfamily domain-containing protein n=1 Tax=Dendryphion nanum TaxID=256645 RepID=A0A9P9DWR3_9PLEO|nr:major facilitator superfamily domain-containing protein [Dendryphion nanum]
MKYHTPLSPDPEGLIPHGITQAALDMEKNVKNTETAETSEVKLSTSEIPFNWPAHKKWSSTIVVVFMTATITFCSSIHAAAVKGVARSFECSNTVATLGVTTFLLGFATGPLLFAPLSEVWGRCLVFRITLFLFFCFNVGCALAPNIAALLVLRFLCGFFGSPTVTNSGGVLADIWPQSHRSVPFALFTTGSSLGPVIAPTIGGFISQYLSWRWHYWVVTIVSGTVYVAMLFFLPETYVTVLLEQKKKRAGIKPNHMSFKDQYATNLTRPWLMLFTEPILFTLGLYSAFVWGILYLDFTAYPVVFQQSRHWSEGISGLSFLGIGVGMAIATASSPWINDIHGAFVKKLGGPKPEARLPHLIIIAWMIPVALFWFGWTANPPTHWIACIAAGVPFGIGFVTLFLGTNAYITDCYGCFSASALAANAVMRSLFSAGFPLFARQMYVKLGTPWASSVLGFIALGMAPVPWLLYRYGPKLRAMSKYHIWTVQLESASVDQI